MQGKAANSDAEAWCYLVGLQAAARFELTAYGGAHGAVIMARAWMHRMQFLYNLYMHSGADSGYRQSDLDAYVEPADFTAFAADLGGQQAARAAWIRGFVPKA